MTDIQFLNYFGTFNEFDNMKKWFQMNFDSYKDIIAAVKERSELELEYSSRLSKINNRILKAFSQSLGSVSTLWTKTAQFMNEESEIHKNLGNRISEDMYKPLVRVSDQFNTSRKPIENHIEKCLKEFLEKRDEMNKCKKKAFLATQEMEKNFGNSDNYKTSHPSSVADFDKEKSKLEKKAGQALEQSTKSEAEYTESILLLESVRNKWEQSFVSGVEKLQMIETDRLNSMKSIIDVYYQTFSKIPATYMDISTRLLREIDNVDIRDDLFKNCMHFTNKNGSVYKTEQFMFDFYAESENNKMDRNRRIENLMKHIELLNHCLKTSENLRLGILKMQSSYEQKARVVDQQAIRRTNREYSKVQSQTNLLCSSLYKLNVAFNHFDMQPEPNNPLVLLSVKIVSVVDRTGVIQSVMESKPGTILPFYQLGILCPSNHTISSSNIISDPYDDNDDFETDYLNEQPSVPERRVTSYVSQSSSNSSSKDMPVLKARAINLNDFTADVHLETNNLYWHMKSLPALPSIMRCEALHDFTGRDDAELSFHEGDIIVIMSKLSDEWWEGKVRGKCGLVPTNYVKELF